MDDILKDEISSFFTARTCLVERETIHRRRTATSAGESM